MLPSHQLCKGGRLQPTIKRDRREYEPPTGHGDGLFAKRPNETFEEVDEQFVEPDLIELLRAHLYVTELVVGVKGAWVARGFPWVPCD